MKTQQLIRKLEKLHQKNDEDGALKLIDEVPDDALPLYAVISWGWVELIDRLDYMRHCEMYDTPDADGNLALHLAGQQGPQMLRAVLASRRLSQFILDFSCLPVSEKSKLIIRKDRPRKAIAIIPGRKAMLLTVLL